MPVLPAPSRTALRRGATMPCSKGAAFPRVHAHSTVALSPSAAAVGRGRETDDPSPPARQKKTASTDNAIPTLALGPPRQSTTRVRGTPTSSEPSVAARQSSRVPRSANDRIGRRRRPSVDCPRPKGAVQCERRKVAHDVRSVSRDRRSVRLDRTMEERPSSRVVSGVPWARAPFVDPRAGPRERERRAVRAGRENRRR